MMMSRSVRGISPGWPSTDMPDPPSGGLRRNRRRGLLDRRERSLRLIDPALHDGAEMPRADDWLRAGVVNGGMQDEWPLLGATQTAVIANQLLERGHFLSFRVEHAVHVDIGRILELIGPAQMFGGEGTKVRQRIV